MYRSSYVPKWSMYRNGPHVPKSTVCHKNCTDMVMYRNGHVPIWSLPVQRTLVAVSNLTNLCVLVLCTLIISENFIIRYTLSAAGQSDSSIIRLGHIPLLGDHPYYKSAEMGTKPFRARPRRDPRRKGLRPRRWAFCPRRDRDRDVPAPETLAEMFGEKIKHHRINWTSKHFVFVMLWDFAARAHIPFSICFC